MGFYGAEANWFLGLVDADGMVNSSVASCVDVSLYLYGRSLIRVVYGGKLSLKRMVYG